MEEYLGAAYDPDCDYLEVRVQVAATRFRVPDVTIIRGGKPRGRIITTPPIAVVEVLSPDDRASEVQERIDDYLNFGIPAVWVLHPSTHRGFLYTADGMREARDGILRSVDGALQVPISAIFPR